MSEILYRNASGVELRADGAGRTVCGVCVPFNEVAEIGDMSGSYPERFERGSTARSVQERGHKIKLMAQHDHQRFPIGKATLFEERSDGLYGEFLVPATRDGDDALELVRSGVLDSFSVAFRPIRHRMEGNCVVRTEVALTEVSLVSQPAYEGAVVSGVRASDARPARRRPPYIPVAVAARRLRLLDIQRRTA